MGKALKFKTGASVYSLEPIKIDRRKLYGWAEKIALDENSEECMTLSLYPDEAMIIPKKGTSMGAIDDEGRWIEKDDLIYVDAEGNPAKLIPSTFDIEIALKEKASAEDILEHNITAVYFLRGDENLSEFVKLISQEDVIYTFIFNYRADYEGDRAFIVESGGKIFILVGKKIEYEYVGLEEAGVIEEEEPEEDDEIDLDFSMM